MWSQKTHSPHLSTYAAMATQLSASIAADNMIPLKLSGSSSPNKQSMSFGAVCMVCTDTAQGNTVFRRHYGVICCEACKCFFRRTVQMGREYKCRFGSNCPVGRTAINMKQVCQACRYNECLKSGMKVECKQSLSLCLSLFICLWLNANWGLWNKVNVMLH